MRVINNYDEAKHVIFRGSQKDFLRYHLCNADCILFASQGDIEILFLDLPDDMVLSDYVKQEIIRRHEVLLKEEEMEYAYSKLESLKVNWDRSVLDEIARRYPRVIDSEGTFIGEALNLVLPYPIQIEDEEQPVKSLESEVFRNKGEIKFRKIFQ